MRSVIVDNHKTESADRKLKEMSITQRVMRIQNNIDWSSLPIAEMAEWGVIKSADLGMSELIPKKHLVELGLYQL